MQSEIKDIYEALSPELKLLLLCLRQQITETKQEAMEMPITGPIDWHLFGHLAVHHRVYPLVYRNLNTMPDHAVPSEVIAMLQQKHLEVITKNLQMAGELVMLLKELEKRGVYAVVLKGLPLAYKLYNNVYIRPTQDLDILVRPEAVEKARAVIEEKGYDRIHLGFAETAGVLRNLMNTQYHLEYRHQEKKISLDLHWKLNLGSVKVLPEIDNCLTQEKIAGQLVNTLGAEELLIYLVVHGAKHAWFRLNWLCDIGILLRQGCFSWQRLYGLAKHFNVEALLNLAIILSRDFLAVSVPNDIANAVMKDHKAQKLVGMAIPFITNINCDYSKLQFGMPLYFQKEKYRFYRQCGWRQKLTHIWGYFSPTKRDIEFIYLPSYFFFIYYLIRPFTCFSRRIADLTRNNLW